MGEKKVLFVCGENAARSQMAEAFFNSLAREWRAESAGTFPAEKVNPLAVRAMGEVGLDISAAAPKVLELGRLGEFDRIISFGCIAKAAFPARDRLEEWPLPDPGKGDLELMRRVRDEIRNLVASLVEELEGGG
ncbi:arsenate reductase ArsC [Candidatus Solincola tengchongensis]|uniref:arsenate reductase ArsC n=1 Tax=Candidatus Solincola tengchongensis TaxID=2900693 RepID=UPI00257E6A90|nr:arsenate reductase ArsC [Candidatus Solincola tengchongensis]